MTNSERAAYLKGLVEGLELDQNSKEVKVINVMVELIDDLCLSIEELEEAYDELSGQVDEIYEDLGLLEDDYYELEDDDSCGCGCGNDCDCGCDDCDCDDFDDDDCEFQVTCPSCEDIIELNEAVLDEGFIICPNCGEKLEFDFDEDDEEIEE